VGGGGGGGVGGMRFARIRTLNDAILLSHSLFCY